MLKKILLFSFCSASCVALNAASSSSSSSFSSSSSSSSSHSGDRGILGEYVALRELFSEQPSYYDFCCNFGLHMDADFQTHCAEFEANRELTYAQRFARMFCLAAVHAARRGSTENKITFLKNLTVLLKLNYATRGDFAAFKRYSDNPDFNEAIDALYEGTEAILLDKLQASTPQRVYASKSPRMTFSLFEQSSSSSSPSPTYLKMPAPRHNRYSGIDPRSRGWTVKRPSSDGEEVSASPSISSGLSQLASPVIDVQQRLDQALRALETTSDMYTIAMLLWPSYAKLCSNMYVRHVRFALKFAEICISKKILFEEIHAVLEKSESDLDLKASLLRLSLQQSWVNLLQSLWEQALQDPTLSSEVENIAQLNEALLAASWSSSSELSAVEI